MTLEEESNKGSEMGISTGYDKPHVRGVSVRRIGGQRRGTGLSPRQRDYSPAGLVVDGVGDAAAACLFSRVVMMLDLFLDVRGLTFSTHPPCRAVGVCMFTGGAHTHSFFSFVYASWSGSY